MTYIKELDSIRGIGILLVIAFHWLPVDSFYNTFPNRPFGVDVFFVLSGFLITRMLLEARIRAEAHGISCRYTIANFFLRRSLRIFPLYYLIILLILISHRWLGANLANEVVPAITYTLNFYFHEKQYWGDLTTHLWTLSIEEQFYLLWPWIILLVPFRFLLTVFGVFTSIGVVSQLCITDMEFGYLPTWTCFDAFGIGAILAWTTMFRMDRFDQVYRILRIIALVSAVILLVGASIPELIFLSPQRTLRGFVAAWAIGYVISRHHQEPLRPMPIFGNPILIFLGKISYGMYLYHLFLPWMYDYINAPVNALLPEFFESYLLPISVVENFLLLVFISWLSYQYFEKPVMRLAKFRMSPLVKAAPQSTAMPGILVQKR